MITEGINAFRNKRVLLLQGPLGPFFRRLASDLEHIGAEVFKVNFNGGDWLFYTTNAINYRGSLEGWPEYFERLLNDLKIDVVFLFGDCRPVHEPVRGIVHLLGVELGVFEEGYLRPDYITLERFGVNYYSLIPRDPKFYLSMESLTGKIRLTKKVGNTFRYAALWAILYYLGSILLWPWFYKYRHHRPLSPLETWPWMKSVWRKGYFFLKERGIFNRLMGPYSKRFFLVPLQVHYDSQIHVHSNFESVTKFICEIIESFALHAPPETILVFKHHPMDRGYIDYTKFIRSKIKKHNLHERCFYIHDQHLPELLKNALGVLVVNSTVGISALYHRAAVKVCGNAIYDIEGLTFQGSIEQFWQESFKFRQNPKLFERFLNYLIKHIQLNGSFYKRLSTEKMQTGIIWADEKKQ